MRLCEQCGTWVRCRTQLAAHGTSPALLNDNHVAWICIQWEHPRGGTNTTAMMRRLPEMATTMWPAEPRRPVPTSMPIMSMASSRQRGSDVFSSPARPRADVAVSASEYRANDIDENRRVKCGDRSYRGRIPCTMVSVRGHRVGTTLAHWACSARANALDRLRDSGHNPAVEKLRPGGRCTRKSVSAWLASRGTPRVGTRSRKSALSIERLLSFKWHLDVAVQRLTLSNGYVRAFRDGRLPVQRELPT